MLTVAATARAEDHLVLVRYPGGLPPPGRHDETATRYTVTGAKFKDLQKDVESVVEQLGGKTVWWDVAPDAQWESLEIYLGPKRYVINSWFPLFRNTDKLAVSEGAGLVSVSGLEEKRRVEAANSPRYRAMVGLFEKVHVALGLAQ